MFLLLQSVFFYWRNNYKPIKIPTFYGFTRLLPDLTIRRGERANVRGQWWIDSILPMYHVPVPKTPLFERSFLPFPLPPLPIYDSSIYLL